VCVWGGGPRGLPRTRTIGVQFVASHLCASGSWWEATGRRARGLPPNRAARHPFPINLAAQCGPAAGRGARAVQY
jgi:hypothetical protein